MRSIQIECLLILNDATLSTVNILRKNIAPLLASVKDINQDIYIDVEYFNGRFEDIYPQVKKRLITAKCSNVFFNLDQCGYSQVNTETVRDIIRSWRSSEILLTFMISSLLAYLSPKQGNTSVPLEPEMQGKIDSLLKSDDQLIVKQEWLGEAEKIVYSYLKNCACYVSPFSINNPSGWRYWLMHFANSYRARQVYNDILHQDDSSQAHFGRAGLNMLSYDPKEEGQLYLFDGDSRQAAKEALYDDIPKFVAESGDTLAMQDFYEAAYNETPAHSDDIHEMIIENPDMEVITAAGGERKQAKTIKAGDTLKLKSQKSMFFMFSDLSNKD